MIWFDFFVNYLVTNIKDTHTHTYAIIIFVKLRVCESEIPCVTREREWENQKKKDRTQMLLYVFHKYENTFIFFVFCNNFVTRSRSARAAQRERKKKSRKPAKKVKNMKKKPAQKSNDTHLSRFFLCKAWKYLLATNLFDKSIIRLATHDLFRGIVVEHRARPPPQPPPSKWAVLPAEIDINSPHSSRGGAGRRGRFERVREIDCVLYF